jgi:hypothetical protein
VKATNSALIIALLSIFGALRVSAQTAAPIGVSVGQRVRVQAPPLFEDRRKGDVFAPVIDTLFLKKKDAAVQPIPVSAITSLEVSRGRQRWLWGFLGATAGFFAGGLLGAQTYDTGESDIDGILASIAGAAIGTVSGAIIGAVAAPERWKKIPVH